MCDKLVYDLSQEIEGSPNVFIRKDWLNILDNQNQNYQNNQSIIDTSQLSNSNKYMSYREAYLAVPMLLTIANSTVDKASLFGTTGGGDALSGSLNQCIGLKNWFGQIIHSFTLDYNGTTIIQQTPFINMWNTFKLMTSLSWNDVITQGATIGFYPDDPTAFVINTNVGGVSGQGVCNNNWNKVLNLDNNNFKQSYDRQNEGLLKRIQSITFNTDASCGEGALIYSGFQSYATCGAIWRSYISKRVQGGGGLKGYQQVSIMATVYLKHIHSFFNMCPLLKGAFMKMTMNLNNSSCSITTTAPTATIAPIRTAANDIGTGTLGVNSSMTLVSVSVPVGGTNPIMMSSLNSINSDQTNLVLFNAAPALAGGGNTSMRNYPVVFANLLDDTYVLDLSVGSKPISNALRTANIDASNDTGGVSKSVYLYIPAYSFNPIFETAYLSNPVKSIKYTDVYQYQVINVGKNQQFNNLITNGIANIKSVLIIPFLNASTSRDGFAGSNWAYLPTGIPTYQSPFDPAGTGTTAPLVQFNNFNIQISGQNAIYNMQRYSFEEWNNQLYGQNAVNGGMSDGLTSGLIDFLGWQSSQCFYYVNVERMLPVEQSVPKSVQIIGSNLSEANLDLFVFVEYGVEVNIDLLTGARV